MKAVKKWRSGWSSGLAFAVALTVASPLPVEAATLRRVGLEELVAGNETIVVGEVLDVHSYWNDEGTFILSDVRVAVDEALKGRTDGILTFTVPGGTVGETTVLIVGGPELVPGRRYVLFTAPDALPGAPKVRSLRDHAQAVFDVVDDGAGGRAVSQARRLALVPDRLGRSEPAGGPAGVALPALVETVRALAAGEAAAPREEVNR